MGPMRSLQPMRSFKAPVECRHAHRDIVNSSSQRISARLREPDMVHEQRERSEVLASRVSAKTRYAWSACPLPNGSHQCMAPQNTNSSGIRGARCYLQSKSTIYNIPR